MIVLLNDRIDGVPKAALHVPQIQFLKLGNIPQGIAVHQRKQNMLLFWRKRAGFDLPIQVDIGTQYRLG